MDGAVEAVAAALESTADYSGILGVFGDGDDLARAAITAILPLITDREARVREEERERIAAELRRLPTAIKPHDPYAQGWWDAGIAEALCWIRPIGEVHTAQRITRMCVEPENEHQLNVRYHSGGPVAGAQPYPYDPRTEHIIIPTSNQEKP
jgi:hypothetical protein